MLDVDVQPEPDPEWLSQFYARQRDELKRAREYRTPARTAEQIRAEAAWSWRQAEREIRERVSA